MKASDGRQGRVWQLIAGAFVGLIAADVMVRQPRWTAWLLALLLPGALVAVQTRRRQIALTFDDGPHDAVTPALLDVLARHGATATFFVVGDQVSRHPEIVERMVADGHELGVHGMDATPTARRPQEEFERELDACARQLAPWGRPRWFRPASGWIRPEQMAALAERGLRCVLGSVVIVRNPVSAPRIAAWLLALRARRGAVVVLHEGAADRANVAEYVDLLLSRLAARGYASVSLSDLAGGPTEDALALA
jgi:peptidoglycan/xylan/chitin deacetylase (PgdA/CDA1 family)